MNPPQRPFHSPEGTTKDGSLADGPNQSQLSTAHAQEAARRQGVLGRTLLVGGLIMLALFGMVVIFISFLCLANTCSKSGRYLVTTAALGKVLTISQVTSHVVPLTVPFVMGLCAYQLGAHWLRSSRTFDPNRPSPLQLGLLTVLCNGASLSALYKTLKFMLKWDKTSKAQDLAIPRLLTRAVAALFYLLFFTYVVSGADAWFHASSKATLIESTSAITTLGSFATDFGRAVNDTQCSEAQAAYPSSSNNSYVESCGQILGLSAHDMGPIREGLRTISNSSSINRVAFTDDQTAILVPDSLPPNISYTAETLGLRAVCKSITSECLNPGTLGGQPDYGPGAYLNLQCRGPTVFNVTIPTTGSIPNGALDANGNVVYGYEVPTNPFNVGAVLTSLAYQGTEDAFFNNTGWFVHGNVGATNVVYCSVSALDVVYTYTGSQFVVRQSSLTSSDYARYIASEGFVIDYLQYVGVTVDGTGIKPGETYEDAYGLEMARRGLGLSADLYITQPASDLQWENQVIGSKLDLAPLVLLLSGIAAYGLFVMIMVFQTIIATQRVPYVRLAALHLTNPLLAVHAQHGPVNAALTWQDDGMAQFDKENEGDRLYVGPVSGVSGHAFGVMRKVQ